MQPKVSLPCSKLFTCTRLCETFFVVLISLSEKLLGPRRPHTGGLVLVANLHTWWPSCPTARLALTHFPILWNLFPIVLRPFSAVRCKLLAVQQINRPCEVFINIASYYDKWLSAPRPTPNLEKHHLSAVRSGLFNIFSATLRVWRSFLHPPPDGRAIPWWQGGWY